MNVELLWFKDCPNHEQARGMLLDTLERHGIRGGFADIDASDLAVAVARQFPGSPTIRVDGVDIEPGFGDTGDYTPRCRLYASDQGLTGMPRPEWIEAAIREAARR